MNGQQFGLVLLGGAWVCAVGCALNLIRLKSRGNSALLLSLAFLALAAVLLMIRAKVDQVFVTLAGLVVVACLVGDFLLRSKSHGAPSDQ